MSAHANKTQGAMQRLRNKYPASYPLWKACQNNAAIAAKELPSGSISLPSRDDVKQFSRYLATHIKPGRRILDVGCGSCPGYMPKTCDIEIYYAIDPWAKPEWLDGARFHFGVAEFLSEYFPGQSFGYAIAATSIDHFLDPLDALREIYSILEPAGELLIWTSAVRSQAIKNAADYIHYENGSCFLVPKGAYDAFHVADLRPKEVMSLCYRAGFLFADIDPRPEIGSVFMRVWK